MKVLIVSNSFLPQNSPRSFRTTELVKEFSNQGHQVTVYVPHFNYDYSEFLSQYKNITLKESVTLRDCRIKILGGKLDYLFYKILEVYFNFPYIILYHKLPKILKDENNYDLLISIAFPHPIHWGTAKAIKNNPKLAKTWIADCGDPFMKNDGLGFRKKKFYFKYFEKNWCRRCDYITVPYEQQRLKYYSEFSEKIKIIPQGYDFESLKVFNEQPHNSIPTFIFAGTFYLTHRNPKLFLTYLSTLSFDFKFIIYTNRQDLVLPCKSLLGNKLEIKDYITRDELIYEMSKADFLVNIENGNSKNEKPSKLIDYALAQRPVLSVNTYQLDEENIQSFLSGDYSGKMEIPNIEQYNIKNVAAQFLALCKE